MIKKTVPKIEVLYVSLRTTIQDVASVAQKHCPAMLRELADLGIQPTGSWIFVAHGMPQDQMSTFILDLCIPATRPAHYVGSYRFKELEEFNCGSIEIQGPLGNLFSHGYAPLLHELHSNGEHLSGQSREVYCEWHGPDSHQNRVELQIGVRATLQPAGA